MNESVTSRARKFQLRALAIMTGLLLGLFVAEICLRVFGIRPERFPPHRVLVWDGIAFRDTAIWGGKLVKRPSPFAADGVTMGEYVPHAVFKMVFASNPRGYFDRDNGVVATINSLGLRGEEVSAEKPQGTYRILGMGDSFTFGEGVRDEDTFLNRLQLRLNAGAPGRSRFQVLNAGVQGYNTRDEVIYLERRWLGLNPDLVLIVFYINDAYDDSAILNRGQELGIYCKKPVGIGRYSYLFDLAQYKYAAYQNSKRMEVYYNQHFFTDARNFLENPGEYRVDWTVCRTAIAHAAQITRERNVRFGLVMFPELSKLQGGYPFLGVHQLVKDTCARLGIPFLDLLDTFQEHKPENLWVHPSNHHPNEMAHAMAAESIERFVREQFLRDGQPRQAASGVPEMAGQPASGAWSRPAAALDANAHNRLIPPDVPQAHNNLANSLLREGRVDEALVELQKAVAIQPDDSEAHNNLGNLLYQKGRIDEAIAHFERAIEIQSGSPLAHYNLANVLMKQNRLEEAASHYQKAVAIQPDYAVAHNNLGQVLLQMGKADEALAHFKQAVDLRPDLVEAHINLGNVFLQKGETQKAIAQFQKILEIRPDHGAVCGRLAWLLATSAEPSVRNGARAVELARRADQLSGGNNPLFVGTLAAAYAEAGQFSEAVASGQRALQLAVAQNNTPLAIHLRSQLELYQAGFPYHDTARPSD